MLNFSLFEGEQKRSVFVCVPLNANELLLSKGGGVSGAPVSSSVQTGVEQ